MKTLKLAAFAFAALFAGAASANGAPDVSELARESGLDEREVAMVFGPSASYASYRTSYRRCKAQLVRTLGEQRFEEVAAAYRANPEAIASNDPA